MPQEPTKPPGIDGPTSASIDRELRRIKRSRVSEEQAAVDKHATATASEQNSEEAHPDVREERNDSPKAILHTIRRNKSFAPASQPDLPHSGLKDLSRAHPSSPDEGLRPELYSADYNHHAVRESNLSSLKREKKPAIKFPSPNDPVWKGVDEELKIAIPIAFNKAKMKRLSVSQLSTQFHDWIHAFFTEKFGSTINSANVTNNTRKPRVHAGLERLRKQKRALKNARKLLLKSSKNVSEALSILNTKWRKLLRQHNRLRIAVKKKLDQRVKRAAENDFKKDPMKFADKLFHGPGQSAAPTFSRETAQEYFAKTYRDENRDHDYSPLEGMLRPGIPRKAFEMRPPTVKQIAKSARRKRNGACPGLDAITYVPFKKCFALIVFLQLLGLKIWKEIEIADDWAQAFMALLKKGSLFDDLEIVSEFRPITMTAAMGKIVLSIVADRLQRFLVKNSYIPRKVQKGFLSGIAGCVEHSFMLFEAMREAKEEQRQIVISWIDLANAYGSVRHNLIQFALNWYHVPKPIQDLIFNYYNKLMAKVVTKEWTSNFFLFDIGLFQGCVVSTILFLCVFQLLLDFLQPLREKYGFHIKQINVKALAEAYADDLALETRNAKGNQVCCDKTVNWLTWTETMAAKPKKCISFGLKRFGNYKSEPFEQVRQGLTYSPFDPKLTIAGKPMHYILDGKADKAAREAEAKVQTAENETEKKELTTAWAEAVAHAEETSFKNKHFKFLGRHIHYNLSETQIKEEIFTSFKKDVETVNKNRVNGLMKLWLYQHCIIYRLTWPLLIHDLDLTFAIRLRTHIQPLLKEWAGIGRTVDVGMLYRTRTNLGLQLTSVDDHYTAMQIVKTQLLQESADENVRNMISAKIAREESMTRLLKSSKLNTVAAAQTKLDLLFPTQPDRQGLGNGRFQAEHTTAEIRKLVSSNARTFAEDKRVQHAQHLAIQGSWTKWHDRVIPYDLSWKNLIYGHGPHVIKFILNATVNWVKTPYLMKLWRYQVQDYCRLCRHPQCTLHHIISNCRHALLGKRYTWRHDSVLLYLSAVFQELIDTANSKSVANNEPPIQIGFVRAGESKPTKKTTINKTTLLSGASDWKLLVDTEESKLVFPPEIYSTPQRPDIVIWSKQTKTVLIVELTCPAEEGIEAAKIRKEAKYFGLKCACASKDRGWSAEILTIEVGVRGFVARTLPRLLKRLGQGPKKISKDIKNISSIVARCTYAIYLARETSYWDVKRELLTAETASKANPNPSSRESS